MANIAATDVTCTVLHSGLSGGGAPKRCNVVKLEFGNGALTYPAGGIPISKGQLGCANVIESLKIFDKGTSGYEWSYDKVNEKLVALQAPAQTHAHDILVKGGAAGGVDEPIGVEGTDTLAKDAATDRTITGAASATKGGVQSTALAAAALAQPSAVAIAAQVLIVEVIGY